MVLLMSDDSDYVPMYELWLKLNEWNMLAAKTLVANPFGIDFFGEQEVSSFTYSSANAVKPEVTS